MPGPFCALSGIPCVTASLVLPLTGAWTLDVMLDRPVDIAGPQIFTVADTTWNCSVIRAIDFTGARSVRLVGGMGGWGKSVAAKSYGSLGSQVPASLVLSTTAASVGEPPPNLAGWLGNPILGTFYCVPSTTAGQVLNTVLTDAWWMDPTGLVQAAPRVPKPIVSSFAALQVKGALGLYTIATESPGDWTPGSLFASPTVTGTVNRSRIVVESGSLRVEAMVS